MARKRTTSLSFLNQIKIITDFIVADLGRTEECYWAPQPRKSLDDEFLPVVRPPDSEGICPTDGS